MSGRWMTWACWLIGMAAVAGAVSGCATASHDPGANDYHMGVE